MLAALGLCQTQRKEPSFEVASVKTLDSPKLLGGRALSALLVEDLLFQGGPGTGNPGRINYSGVTMRMLVARAFSVKVDQVAGPNWIDQQHYQILANVPLGSDDRRVRLMLRSLLAERFQLSLRRESKTLAVYALVVAKGGPRLKPAETPPQPEDPKEKAQREREAEARFAAHTRGQTRFHARSANMGTIIDFISMHLDQPVLDRTDLEGNFAVDLTYFWRPPGAADSASMGPSVFEALKAQLGLELISRKEEVEVLVIDRANRLPTSN